MIEWVRIVGDRREKIVIEDVIDSINASMSLILKEMNYNDAIKDNPKAKAMYERHRDIMQILKSRFEDMLNAVPREPKHTIPKKKFHIVGR